MAAGQLAAQDRAPRRCAVGRRRRGRPPRSRRRRRRWRGGSGRRRSRRRCRSGRRPARDRRRRAAWPLSPSASIGAAARCGRHRRRAPARRLAGLGERGRGRRPAAAGHGRAGARSRPPARRPGGRGRSPTSAATPSPSARWTRACMIRAACRSGSAWSAFMNSTRAVRMSPASNAARPRSISRPRAARSRRRAAGQEPGRAARKPHGCSPYCLSRS